MFPEKWMLKPFVRWASGMEEVEAGSRAEEAAKFKRSLRKTLQRLENVLPDEMKVDEEVRMGTDGIGWDRMDRE